MKPKTTRPAVLLDEIDLLVDGVLGEERRRELLKRLDGDAEGWKKCALGFLEAQMWGGAMENESFAAEAKGPRRKWVAPLAAMAAAVLGFAVAWFGFPKEEGGVANPGGEVNGKKPERVVQYVPFPVERGAGLVPVSDESGQFYYTTRGNVPGIFLDAMEQAGHKVEHIERMVNLPQEEGEPLELPVTETRILINHQL